MTAVLPIAVALVALLYASVGHAGATGYIAVMALLGLEPRVIRPTALVLNVIVATIGTVQFFRAGHFRAGLFLPLAIASIPCAVIGGAINLPTGLFEVVLGIVLLVSAARIVGAARMPDRSGVGASEDVRGMPPAALPAVGAAIGLLSGLTGVGGGVFLTPLLLACNAAPVKTIAGVTAPFILVNSLAGLVGGLLSGRSLPRAAFEALLGVVLGFAALRLLMAAVLAIASVKLLGEAAWN